MRTVLSKTDLVFEEGYRAYEAGTHREDNPYPTTGNHQFRNAWFAGWDRAQECGGTCDG